ncbi:hypothetical protein GUITHDRAFT_101450 [Guillardia theta CCMP2712]|uniref:PDZ domain-containing protein n=1 Tax=Guillardia theta (strain CCMP2712) TaxID=905079 RepID=L1JXB2_GUITC|nr:hypothetical protein GUITHDRAFT_101450 [Guillardia theta CCMP2712]EKX53002.1 hypothetical protein GUITHDRAFT_101450 [Guillardia theta CCMP2712]|eukprot:XP_005839982.1 hypothetical protein GUITHDRAFT_101450 [Guillardia theta CCMP2712]
MKNASMLNHLISGDFESRSQQDKALLESMNSCMSILARINQDVLTEKVPTQEEENCPASLGLVLNGSLIESVIPGGPADAINSGDRIVEMNGNQDVSFNLQRAEDIKLLVQRNADVFEVELRSDTSPAMLHLQELFDRLYNLRVQQESQRSGNPKEFADIEKCLELTYQVASDRFLVSSRVDQQNKDIKDLATKACSTLQSAIGPKPQEEALQSVGMDSTLQQETLLDMNYLNSLSESLESELIRHGENRQMLLMRLSYIRKELQLGKARVPGNSSRSVKAENTTIISLDETNSQNKTLGMGNAEKMAKTLLEEEKKDLQSQLDKMESIMKAQRTLLVQLENELAEERKWKQRASPQSNSSFSPLLSAEAPLVRTPSRNDELPVTMMTELPLCHGIGLEISHTIPFMIINLTPGSPAFLDGRLAIGDVLMAVDGVRTAELDYIGILDKMIGLEGTVVQLQVRPIFTTLPEHIFGFSTKITRRIWGPTQSGVVHCQC